MRTDHVGSGLLVLALAGCGQPRLAVELLEGTIDADHSGWLIAVPNLDDDDEDGVPDWEQAPSPGAPDDDLVEFFLSPDAVRRRGKKHLELRLTGDLDMVRIWHRGSVVLGDDDGTPRASFAVEKDTPDFPFKLEIGAPLARAELTLTLDDETLVIPISGAPLVINHHLQPAEEVHVLRADEFGYSNVSMVNAMREVLGDRLIVYGASQYQYDVWVQDEPEFGTFTAPGHRLDLVIDSVRNGGLDDLPKDLAAPGTTWATWGRRTWGTTYDSFGNFEATPPISVGGVDYPFGRAYWGGTFGQSAPDTEMTGFLDAQLLQAPFSIDTTWLCVGHVDEFTAFVPDASAPRGFRFLVNDVAAGYAVLEAMDPDTELPRYRPGYSHGLGTVGEILDEPGLRQYNEDVQANHIEPVIDIFRAEIGLLDEEIVRFPGIFHEVGGADFGGVCGAAALIPGSINLLIAQPAGEAAHVFMADPFLRSDSADPSSDPMIAAIAAIMPNELELHFVDDFDVYHLGLGEVHCATNTRRTPIADWWELGAHLVLEDK